ncbi:hypothetical protein MLGJGCBP_01721 [Rhodococcus sp. T7]|nr:hypothetical protein MLGJGCBP_09116 [Rhodococcus sp. T7]KAF0965121.1 hypothetical protein MLGJGCBP_01721 [Rhodococcus sp. T7]
MLKPAIAKGLAIAALAMSPTTASAAPTTTSFQIPRVRGMNIYGLLLSGLFRLSSRDCGRVARRRDDLSTSTRAVLGAYTVRWNNLSTGTSGTSVIARVERLS